MKQIILSFAVVTVAISSFAQSDKFKSAMQKNIILLDSAKTSEEFTAVAANFERIGDAEKTQWLPYYYAALSNIWKGFSDKNVNKDEVADKADALVAKADVIEPKNSEIYLLKSMSSTLRMLVDPMSRWQKYGGLIKEEMATAKQLNPENPRVYFWEGQNLFGTPAQFGGGKDKAKPVFEKSIVLFKTYKPANELAPNWGVKATERMLEQCK